MKKNIYTLIVFLICSFSFAQLTVKNSTYIFVDGTSFTSGPTVAPLFVTDNVRVEGTGHIYLRNNAQLLQGTGSTGNSGTGNLSVYQEGTVDNYAYNYWASPVGDTSVDNTGNSNLITTNASGIINEVTGLISRNPATYAYINDGTASPLTISNKWLYGFSPGTVYADWDYLGTGTPLEPGYGFSMKGTTGSTNQRYDFAGKPNSGNINIAILDAQFTLAGNPYPSALNSWAFIHDADNRNDMLGALLFWEHDPTVNSHILTDYVGGYARYTVNAAGTVGTFVPATFYTLGSDGFPTGPGSPSGSTKQVRQFLPIAQGFMIEGDIGTDGTASVADGIVTFKNNHRAFYKETDADSEFFKTSSNNTNTEDTTLNYTEFQYNDEGFQILPQDYRRFRLNVDFNDEVTRPLVANFHADATDGFDYGLECNNSEPTPRDAYFILGDMPFVAQAHQYDINLKIPLVVTTNINLPLKVRIYDIQHFNDEPIYIHDKLTDIYYDLTALNFNINLEAGTYTDRFEVTFTNGSTLSTDDFADSAFTVFQNNTLSQLVVANPKSLNIKSVGLVDISGKQVFQKTNLTNNTRYEFSTKNLSDGVYITTITLDNNRIISKKVVITNK